MQGREDGSGCGASARRLWLGFQDGRRKDLHQTLIEALVEVQPGRLGRRAAAGANGVLETDRFPRSVPNKTRAHDRGRVQLKRGSHAGQSLRAAAQAAGMGEEANRRPIKTCWLPGECPKVARARGTWFQRPESGSALNGSSWAVGSPARLQDDQAARNRSRSNGFLRSSM